jgi:hypothetical protein
MSRTINDHSIHQTEVSTDEYAVYDTVIGATFTDIKTTGDTHGKIPVKSLVIKDRTVLYPPQGLGPDQNLGDMVAPSIHPQMFADYRTKNQQPATLNRSFNLKVDFVMFNVLANSLKSRPSPSGNGVDGSYIVSLSRVGFDNAHTEALVYMQYVCGGLCGEGLALFVVKENGAWKVNRVSMLWIS